MSIDAGPSTADAVLTGLGAAIDQATALSDLDLETLGPAGIVEFAQRFERLRNQLAVLDHTIAAACDTIGAADRQAMASTAKLLAHALRISPAEARGRVTAAEELRPTRSATGEPIPSKRPVLAAKVADGLIGPAQLGTALRTLGKVDHTPNIDPAVVARTEELLAEHAVRLTPTEFRMVTDRVLDHLDPDGTEPRDRYHDAHRDLRWWKTKDGSFRIEGRLTPAVGTKLGAVLQPLAQSQDGPDGPDIRSREHRNHDALETLLDRVLRSGGLPDTGGIAATIIITINADDLTNRTGYGTYPDGTPVAPATLRRLADETEIFTVLHDSRGAVLDLGRTRRLADKPLTVALYARDRGCSFPGCGMAPQWCQRHHIKAWIDGGETSINNMTLLCTYHHHNFERLQWTCRMINGIPWWIPPTYIDPKQTPLRNTRIDLYGPGTPSQTH